MLTALVATAGVVAVCCILAFLTPLDFTKCAWHWLPGLVLDFVGKSFLRYRNLAF